MELVGAFFRCAIRRYQLCISFILYDQKMLAEQYSVVILLLNVQKKK